MVSALEKLDKILALEEDQGYRNKAVIGGLDKFAAFWYEEAHTEGADPAFIQLVEEVVQLLREYPGAAERENRRQIVARVRGRIREYRIAAQEKPIAAGQEPGPGQRVVEELPQPAPPSPRLERSMAGLESPITKLPGISTVYTRRLQRLGIEKVGDLLYLFPRRYDDYRALKTINHLEYGEQVTIIGSIWDTNVRQTRSGGSVVTSIISDSTSTIQATWFNQPYLAQRLKPGREIVLSGKVDEYLGRLVLSSPEWEPLDQQLIHTGRLVPVYPLTEGLSQRWLRRLIKKTVDYWARRLPDYLPQEVRERADLRGLEWALQQIHFPDNWDTLEEARRRLAFEEFLLIQLGVLRQRHRWRSQPGIPISVEEGGLNAFIESLPFHLTSAQERVLREIIDDLRRPEPMSRLLQGDVGSGKTVIAVAAMLVTVAAGYQAVMMAPTEILAEQHYKSIIELLSAWRDRAKGEEFPAPTVRLLTGSLAASEKETIYNEIAAGEMDIVLGTHALIQEGVSFKDLALAVIDEQHRFGVRQRSALRSKGCNPHVLVMSATPIPRTLALTIYGDLDLSVVDEMPPGRQVIKTRWLRPTERERAYNFVRNQVQKGHQAFIICPLVEESEKVEAKSAVEEYERLRREIFPDLRLGLLHGRMKGDEKEAVMTAFRQGALDILVSTAVVEVGIDVPNATVMLVEGADRFGLAQLHQFRGRVGRGPHESYCLLLAESVSEEAARRLTALEESQDGFYLAEEDLKIRGPGEFFGTRQSGLPNLKLARLGDLPILEKARNEARHLFAKDPALEKPEHRLLAHQVEAFWQGTADLS
jgi:ATP-dependent DNA helicase RecG